MTKRKITATITFPYNLFNALQAAAAEDDTRYYLNGILLDFKRKQFIATNGHRLLKMPMDYDPDVLKVTTEELFVEREIIMSRTSKKAPKGGSLRVILYENGDIEATGITTTGIEKWTEVLNEIEGDYPDYERVIPKDRPNGPVGPIVAINIEYLGGVVQALDHKYQGIRILPGESESDPLLIEISGHKDLTYVVMPMRM